VNNIYIYICFENVVCVYKTTHFIVYIINFLASCFIILIVDLFADNASTWLYMMLPTFYTWWKNRVSIILFTKYRFFSRFAMGEWTSYSHFWKDITYRLQNLEILTSRVKHQLWFCNGLRLNRFTTITPISKDSISWQNLNSFLFIFRFLLKSWLI
jgi:hypothetical protein